MFGFSFFNGWVNLKSESNGFYFFKPTYVLMVKISSSYRCLEYFSLPAFLKEMISMFLRLCTHTAVIWFLHFISRYWSLRVWNKHLPDRQVHQQVHTVPRQSSPWRKYLPTSQHQRQRKWFVSAPGELPCDTNCKSKWYKILPLDQGRVSIKRMVLTIFSQVNYKKLNI